MNGTINNEEMAEAFVCNHKYNQNIYNKDIFSIESSIIGYSQLTSSSLYAARLWILSHSQSCAGSKVAENKTKHNQTTFTTQNIRTFTEPLASLRVK